VITDSSYSATVDASGAATISVRTGRQTWKIQQVSTELSTAPLGAACTIRKNGAIITAMVPTGDVADGEPPITLRSPDTMTIGWVGCVAGDVAKATIVYDDGSQ